jgi:outer membrane protein assembly factor BamB
MTLTKSPGAVELSSRLPAATLVALLTVCQPTANSSVAAGDAIPTSNYDLREVSGWTVHLNRALLATTGPATEHAIELLSAQLEEIVRRVPPGAVAELRKVPLWISPEYPGEKPRAEYHPNAGWLREHGRDPAMAKAVEFTNVRIFEPETRRMPNFTLHELAHAYHDRVLPGGFENASIKKAHETARLSGNYDNVEQRFGDGRTANGRAYAIANPQEYFAESTEAFFSTNDFFPFTREELRRHDPEMFTLLDKLWGLSETRKQWSQFRGPNGSGVAGHSKPPLKIIPDQPAWKTALPPGKSSPALWNGRIILTGVEGGRLVTLALDAGSGKVEWKQLAPEVPLESVHAANSVAASTPCADESGLFVYFGSYGLLCYSHDGRELWRKPLPAPQNMYGVSTSPILFEGRLFLILDDDANLPDSQLSRSKVVALDKATGVPLWETPRPYNRGAWTTPLIWEHDAGTDLVVVGNGRVYGYEPATGAEKWFVSGFAREPIAVPVGGDAQLYVSVSMQGGRGDLKLDPEPFWKAMLSFDRNDDGRIGRDEITEGFTLPFRPELPPGDPGFGMPLPSDSVRRKEAQLKIFDWRDKNHDGFWTKEEFVADMTVGFGQPNLVAIRPGGTGDITASHVAWNLQYGIPEIPSPLFYSGRLYLVRDGGILSCVNAATGQVFYRERLGATGQYMASPVLANDHLYLLSAKGVLSVVKDGTKFELVHQAALNATIAATPVIHQNSLYVRTDNAMLAFR